MEHPIPSTRAEEDKFDLGQKRPANVLGTGPDGKVSVHA